MPRLNFTLDGKAVSLLGRLARKYYGGNKSLTVRRALESLAAHAGHEGWRIAGYTPVTIEERAACHTCGGTHRKGEVLYRPVFERGEGPNALAKLPKENWLDCPDCVEQAAR
ncbi:MAG: hypothetical protein ACE5IM_03985 [Nitrospinota bacterium]